MSDLATKLTWLINAFNNLSQTPPPPPANTTVLDTADQTAVDQLDALFNKANPPTQTGTTAQAGTTNTTPPLTTITDPQGNVILATTDGRALYYMDPTVSPPSQANYTSYNIPASGVQTPNGLTANVSVAANNQLALNGNPLFTANSDAPGSVNGVTTGWLSAVINQKAPTQAPAPTSQVQPSAQPQTTVFSVGAAK